MDLVALGFRADPSNLERSAVRLSGAGPDREAQHALHRTGALWADIPERRGPHTTRVNHIAAGATAGVSERLQRLMIGRLAPHGAARLRMLIGVTLYCRASRRRAGKATSSSGLSIEFCEGWLIGGS
jgi:hypothetical protein